MKIDKYKELRILLRVLEDQLEDLQEWSFQNDDSLNEYIFEIRKIILEIRYKNPLDWP